MAGCNSSDGKARVTGSVTFQGEPVGNGFVTFYPPGGARPEAGKIEEGKYSLRVAPGECKVTVEGMREEGFNQAMNQPNLVPFVPAKYNTESTLSRTLVEGDNVVDFHLD